MKSFALERLDSEIFEEKSKHTNFGKTKYFEYNNILLDNFKFAFGVISEEKKENGYADIDKLFTIKTMATNFDESDFEKIDLFKDNKFYKFNYRVGKPVKFAKIIAIDTNICFKIRQKKFILNRILQKEIRNELKQNSNVWKV